MPQAMCFPDINQIKAALYIADTYRLMIYNKWIDERHYSKGFLPPELGRVTRNACNTLLLTNWLIFMFTTWQCHYIQRTNRKNGLFL